MKTTILQQKNVKYQIEISNHNFKREKCCIDT